MEDYRDLSNAGYDGRIDLPTHLTRRVNERISEKGTNPKDLAAKIYEPLDLAPVSAKDFIDQIKFGHAARLIPSPFRKTRPPKRERRLYKISVLLHALEIEETDPIIQRFRRNYEDFVYPPEYENQA